MNVFCIASRVARQPWKYFYEDILSHRLSCAILPDERHISEEAPRFLYRRERFNLLLFSVERRVHSIS